MFSLGRSPFFFLPLSSFTKGKGDLKDFYFFVAKSIPLFLLRWGGGDFSKNPGLGRFLEKARRKSATEGRIMAAKYPEYLFTRPHKGRFPPFLKGFPFRRKNLF